RRCLPTRTSPRPWRPRAGCCPDARSARRSMKLRAEKRAPHRRAPPPAAPAAHADTFAALHLEWARMRSLKQSLGGDRSDVNASVSLTRGDGSVVAIAIRIERG